MAKPAAVLGVHLFDVDGVAVRVGTLSRDAVGATAFTPDEAYLRDAERPILSLSWHVPGDPEATRARLAARTDKIALYGGLPPWFEGVLPEGALRELVAAEMGPGDHGSFDVITRLGADLAGAVLVVPENAEALDTAGPLDLARVAGFRAPVPKGFVKFSLAGVQLKFTSSLRKDKFAAPARAGEGRYIVKLDSEKYPRLPQAEFAGMTLASLAGVRTAPFSLIDRAAIADVPANLIVGDHALAVERFDRPGEGRRIHIEDMAQILGAAGDQKYTKGNSEMILRMIQRFSTDWRDDVLQGFRRLVVDVMLGNGDNHLKNWSFIFPEPGQVRLSPAYDIVPTVLYGDTTLALPFAGIRRFSRLSLHQFDRAASYLRLDPAWIRKEVKMTVQRALDLWPAALADLPLDPADRDRLIGRWANLTLVAEARA
ncbi:type II toxin-antitoxin system HipA family toxin [Caulobacter sp. FWC26]|uniref:type II toxin-antitoxin system HipA family toxin n=1 Tax=Caulobacter sp. FWC26 TaxID=69665 RepID=UPI000C15C263|nr:type II toxin-antitoxin system HipA family toxin [Caulobacter sp. FWC26]AZS19198.1 type II toxin-antitoxin system HipA family toxin [Caulobacter sp. FWC26]